ncbi:thioredoxin family protein [uncultured Lutibacter sp.]|uniref:thioredoxin family protein n=1 Tax=uncultured Lutibacter sp. TaxID=437739 RepID=UPI002631626A|nr:thioredoxin family protein [uncultured Lutibacter sp.]
MKKSILGMLLLLVVTISNAQKWQTNFEEAKNLASKENKNIILVFQGSDWCAPCIKLNKEIWSTEEFKTYSEKNYVMLLADFPRKKKNELSDTQQQQNNQLMEKYNLQGYFPFVAVLDKNANLLGNTGYKKISPSEYIKLLNSFKK